MSEFVALDRHAAIAARDDRESAVIQLITEILSCYRKEFNDRNAHIHAG